MLNSKEIKILMEMCVRRKEDLKNNQYKNGTYSRNGGDNAQYGFEMIYDKLSKMYDEIYKEEIKKQVKKELGILEIKIE